MATRDGAAAIGRDDLGALEPGRWADLVHVDLADPAFVDPADDVQLLSNLVWAAGARLVRDVWVAGRAGAGRRRTRPAWTARPRPATSARSPPASTPDPRVGTFSGERMHAQSYARVGRNWRARCTISGSAASARSARSAMRKRPQGTESSALRVTTPRRRKASWSSFSSRAGPYRSWASTTTTIQPRRFEVAQSGFVGLDASDMRGVAVVLDRDTQLLASRGRGDTARAVESRTGSWPRHRKPEVDDHARAASSPRATRRGRSPGRRVSYRCACRADRAVPAAAPAAGGRNAGRFVLGQPGEGLVDHGERLRRPDRAQQVDDDSFQPENRQTDAAPRDPRRARSRCGRRCRRDRPYGVRTAARGGPVSAGAP